jgi:hypothetical protein
MSEKNFPEEFYWGETGVGPRRKAGLSVGEGGGVAEIFSRKLSVTGNTI